MRGCISINFSDRVCQMQNDALSILIIEDEKDIRNLLAYHLKKNLFNPLEASHAEEALQKISLLKPHLIILDLMLPKTSGLDLCQLLKKNIATQNIPILMLTAESSKEDIVKGLELGADDYVTKPFDIKEVMARIKAILRRTHTPEKSLATFTHKELMIDWEKYRLHKNSQEIHITLTEFKLLKILTQYQGRVLTREQLLSALTGDEKVVIDRNIDVHITSLRKKIGPYIETVRGIGYRFQEG